MSRDHDGRMTPGWRSVAGGLSSRLSSFKEAVSQKDIKALIEGRPSLRPEDAASGSLEGLSARQKLSQWAGEKIRRKNSMVEGYERISLFPGWAARRYHDPERANKEGAEFTLEVYVSGFAASYPPPELASRSQRAFMRLAKAFAALPKLPASTDPMVESMPALKLSDSAEDLLKHIHLPPTPSEITEETELEALEHQFRHMDTDSEAGSMSSGDSQPPSPMLSASPGTSSPHAPLGTQTPPDASDLYRLHANLNERLQAFWSRALPNRTIRLSVRTCNADPKSEPVATQDVLTTPQGAFQTLLHIPWKSLCEHPDALYIAFGDPQDEHDLHLEAELLPMANPISAVLAPTFTQTVKNSLLIPITQSTIRLISDIDDTIKLSNILGGARAVFRNVFVRQLEELVIKGMGEWYTGMWSRGVRFHYVSNGPYELLPVVNEFIKVSNLPNGSIRLKAYTGRSLFNGLLSTPALRKREGILDILNAFTAARFFLVGDTGEQDLELYAQLAEERHTQILAVFVRDASGQRSRPLDDPTGENIKQHHAPALRRSASFGFSARAKASLPTPSFRGGSDGASPSTARTPTQPDFDPTPRPAAAPPRLMPTSYKSRGPLRASSLNVSSGPSDYFSMDRPASDDKNKSFNTPVRSPTDPTPSINISSTLLDVDMPRAESPTTSISSDVALAAQSLPGILSPAEIQALPPAERKRYELQVRVWKARLQMPSHIPLRIFVEPEECVEASRILDNLTQPQQNMSQ